MKKRTLHRLLMNDATSVLAEFEKVVLSLLNYRPWPKARIARIYRRTPATDFPRRISPARARLQMR